MKNTKKIRARINGMYEYRRWKSDVFTRDNFSCVFCQSKSFIEADHYPVKISEIIKEYSIENVDEATHCEKLWDINNGRTLCWDCHKKVHSNIRR